MTNDGPQDHTYVSEVFPEYKKPVPLVDVNSELDSPNAQSAADASKEIEEIAQTITNIPSVEKDPSSRFMTSRDVQSYQRALNLGLIKHVRNNKAAGVGNLQINYAQSLQGCPVCSISTRSMYQMEWVEDAGLYHCFRCGLEINPTDKLQEDVLPEEQTNFGLSAIDDVNPDHSSGQKPFLAVSNRTRKKNTSAFDKLKDYNKRKEEMNQLKGFKIK